MVLSDRPGGVCSCNEYLTARTGRNPTTTLSAAGFPIHNNNAYDDGDGVIERQKSVCALVNVSIKLVSHGSSQQRSSPCFKNYE